MRENLRASLLVALIALSSPVGCRGIFTSEVDAGPAVVGARDTSPSRTPPPLRAPHPPTPALPDLPIIQAHVAPAPVPFGINVDNLPCRGVWTGEEVQPLNCLKSASLFGHGQDGAVALVPASLLAPRPAHLPAIVDHRLDGTEGPVRNQGAVPACTAFAAAAALDHAVSRWTGKATQLSVMQFWARYHTPLENRSIASNLGLPLSAEESWPFKATEASAWVECAPGTKGTRCGKAIDPTHAKQADSRPAASFTRVEHLPSIETAILKERLAAGQDVIVAMLVTDTFAPAGRPGARYIPHYTKASPDTGHALVLAGYVTLPHGTYFLMHNSWGSNWGDGGYAWIHEATLTTWAHEALVLDAEPAQPSPNQRPRRGRGETTCDGALVPDSIRGTCAPACPDTSPRHDGVCPIAGQCPVGYVNLTGVCVLAAPNESGRDTDTGIAWACGPGGCAYSVPKAYDAACTGGTCKLSCPAPDFRLARGATALTCVE